jgi:hypothetical protein
MVGLQIPVSRKSISLMVWIYSNIIIVSGASNPENNGAYFYPQADNCKLIFPRVNFI